MDAELKQFYPPIDAEVKINAGLFLKLAEAAGEEHVPIDTFAERLLEGALRDFRIFKTTWPPPTEKRSRT